MLNTPKQYKSLKFIKPITWEKILSNWKGSESNQKSWQKHWTKRGYDSWEDWRSYFIKPLQPEKHQWFLYEIENPTGDSLSFYGVPSRGWIEKIGQKKILNQIKDIIKIPFVLKNEKIDEVRDNFPKETMLIGISCNNKIIIYEGTHRTCALATWNKNKPFKEKVFIALTEHKGEIPIVQSGYKK